MSLKIRAESGKQNQVSDSQRTQAGKELGDALNGLREWLDYTVAYAPQGRFWDPGQNIRKQIQLCLKLLSARPTDWDTLVTNAESVGSMLEDENDRARRDEARTGTASSSADGALGLISNRDQQFGLLPSTRSALQARLVWSISLRISSFSASMAFALSSSASAAA